MMSRLDVAVYFLSIFAIVLSPVTSECQSDPTRQQQKAESVEKVIILLGTEPDYIRTMLKIDETGCRYFPAFETLLKDDRSDPWHVSRLLLFLCSVKSDRKQFHDLAVHRLAHSDAGVRMEAVKLLSQIGNEHDTAPVIALLSDGDFLTAYRAAETLTAIGGPKDLMAMNAWLNATDHKRFLPEYQLTHDSLRRYMTKFRDELKERLDKQKELKK